MAKEIIDATKEGAGEIPVSVKTRIGFKEIATEEWIGFLLQQDLSLITVHGRTAAEMSKVPAHWDEIGKAVQIRDHMFPRSREGEGQGEGKPTLIFGNGDVQSLSEAKEKVEKYHVDGVMIGRGIFHNPWLFAGIDPTTKSIKERLELLEKHVKLFQNTWGAQKSFQILKKYFKVYLSDFEGAVDMRMKFMQTNSYEEALSLVANLLPSS